MFDYSDERNLNLPETGCSHWLLRMPIQSWKIALVPVVLKTLWVTTLWVAFVLTLRLLADERPPLFAPSLVFSAITIWILTISWRPFRSSWHRMVVLAVAVPVLYLCVAGAIIAPVINQVEWRPTATAASVIGAILLYGSGVWTLVRSVDIARTNATGIVPERGKTKESSLSQSANEQVRQFNSPRHALAAHDHLQSQMWLRRTFIVGVIPAILIFVLLIPVSIPSVVIVLFVFAYLGAIAISKIGAADGSPSLPPYLAASPLSSATIAWTRFSSPMVIATGVFFCVLIVFAGWACWPENREAWIRWAGLRTREAGSTDTVIVGLRWSAAIVIASAAFFMGRLATTIWFGLGRRTWQSVVISLLPILIFLVLMGFVLRWFMQQTDWESTRESALAYTACLPYIVIGLLSVKVAASATVAAALWSRKLASGGAISKVLGIWAAITLLVGTSTAMLVPDPRVTFLWCFAVAAITIPLARVLALPLSLAWNRHR
jgi:hypothetical protein